MRDAFAVFYNGRRYTMRSVPGDVLEALTEFHKFAMARLASLTGREGLEYATGTNYKGQKVTGAEQFRDVASSVIPIGLRNVAARLPGLSSVGDPDKSLSEEAISSLELKTNRASPVIDARRIAHAWMSRQPGFKPDTGTYPPSQYSRLRNALEDNDTSAARSAYLELLAGSNALRVAKGFRESLLHPLTGSQKQDQQMLRDLPPEDRETVKTAIARRQQILQRFGQMNQAPTLHSAVRASQSLIGFESSC